MAAMAETQRVSKDMNSTGGPDDITSKDMNSTGEPEDVTSKDMNSTGGPEDIIISALWKTQLCSHWRKKHECLYGDRCAFAHGEQDLRPPPPNAPSLRKRVRERKRGGEGKRRAACSDGPCTRTVLVYRL